MTLMQKVTATWTGWSGAPGTSTFYLQGASILDPVIFYTFFNNLSAYFNTGLRIQVNGAGEIVDSSNGQVNGTWSSNVPPLISGTGSGGVHLLAEGPMCRLDTGSFRRGKHIRGRLYLIPCQSVVLDSTGNVATAVKATIETGLNSLKGAAGGQWGVFHRPVYDRTVKPPVLKFPGEFLPMQTVSCNTKPAVLRSRRD